MVEQFKDPDGGFFDTHKNHETLLFRPKDIQDKATPSGNALAVTVLLLLAEYGNRTQWRSLAEDMLASNLEAITRYPTGFAQWLCAADFALGPIHEVAVVGDSDHPQTQALLKTLWKSYRPHQVAAISAFPPGPGSPILLKDRPLQNNQPTAYVCEGLTCLQPVNSPSDMEAQLTSSPGNPTV